MTNKVKKIIDSYSRKQLREIVENNPSKYLDEIIDDLSVEEQNELDIYIFTGYHYYSFFILVLGDNEETRVKNRINDGLFCKTKILHFKNDKEAIEHGISHWDNAWSGRSYIVLSVGRGPEYSLAAKRKTNCFDWSYKQIWKRENFSIKD